MSEEFYLQSMEGEIGSILLTTGCGAHSFEFKPTGEVLHNGLLLGDDKAIFEAFKLFGGWHVSELARLRSENEQLIHAFAIVADAAGVRIPDDLDNDLGMAVGLICAQVGEWKDKAVGGGAARGLIERMGFAVVNHDEG